MENMNTKVIENENIEETTEVAETSDGGNAGALVAGIVGGFLAYAIIGGAKKLLAFVETKRQTKNAAELSKTEVVEAEFTEVENDPLDSGEEGLEE